MTTFEIEGAKFDADKAVVQHIHKIKSDQKDLQEKNDTLEKEHKELQAKYDALEEAKTKLDKDLEEAKKANPDKIDEEVDVRIGLIEKAKKFDVELKVDDDSGKITLSNEEIKKVIICKDAPEGTAEKLEKADSVYIDARYDAMIELLEANKENSAADGNAEEIHNGDGKTKTDKEPKTSKQSHADMVDDLTHAHEKKEK